MSESVDRIPSGDPPQRISVTRHEKNLRGLRCCVSASPFVTLHHTHGGSVQDAGWHVGVALKQNPFLQIPLQDIFHIGDRGIDTGFGVRSWEYIFGTQMEHLRSVNEQLDYDIWEQAELWNKQNWKSKTKVKSHLS